MNCMVNSKEHYKFDLGVKGLGGAQGELTVLPKSTTHKPEQASPASLHVECSILFIKPPIHGLILILDEFFLNRAILNNSLKRPISIIGNEMHYITSTIIDKKLLCAILVSQNVCLIYWPWVSFYYVCIIPYTVNCNWWILKDSLPIGKNSFYKVLLNLLQIFYCFSFFLQVLSLTVNILRTIFLKSESGHWSEMILLLQVGQTQTNIYKSDLKVSCL